MYLVDAVFLNAQMDRNEASLSVELRQAACRRISNFLPDLVRNLTTPSNCEQVRSQIPSLVLHYTSPQDGHSQPLYAVYGPPRNLPGQSHLTSPSTCDAGRSAAAWMESPKNRTTV